MSVRRTERATAPHERRGGFTLVELTAALGILALLFGCFYTALHGVRRAHDRFTQETHAVLVLGNVMARAGVATSRSTVTLRALLDDELGRSPLQNREDVTTACMEQGEKVLLSVLHRDRVVASLEVPR